MSGIMPRSVVAHGDFVNRLVSIPDRYFMTRALLKEFEVVADAGSEEIYRKLSANFSDAAAPVWWRPQNPLDALAGVPAVIAILVHPRQWTCNRVANLRLDIVRIWEEAAWRTRRIAGSFSPPIRTSN